MHWREHSWEFVVSVLSWIVAITVLGLVAVYVVAGAIKRASARRRPQKTDSFPDAARSPFEVIEVMELTS